MSFKLRTLCACAVLLSGCGSNATKASNVPPSVPFGLVDKSVNATTNSTILAADLRAGSLTMYAQVANQKLGPNTVFSPFAIQLAMGMMDLSAQGTTVSDMQNAMHWSLQPNDLGPAFKTLTTLIATSVSQDANVTLATGTRMWADKAGTLIPAYSAAVQDSFQASVVQLDIANDATGSADAINAWVSQQTRGLIPTILTADDLTGSNLVQTAALYFAAPWSHPMAVNERGTFTTADNANVTSKTISQEASFPCLVDPNFTAVDITYSSDTMAILAIMPKNGIDTFLPTLDGETFGSIIAKLQTESVYLTMPAFDASTQPDVTQALEGLGLSVSLTQDADFAVFEGSYPNYIQAILEKATISVDENGTKAAAAAAVISGTASATMGPEPEVISLDHPFLYFIHDKATNTILFMGQVDDPSQKT